MGILDEIMGAGGGQAVAQLARQFGINEGQANAAVKALLPALSGGVKRNIANGGGLDALVAALTRSNHEQYLEDSSKLADSDTVADGNAILGHILGSKDVSRNVARHAAEQTGLDDSTLKRMLPLVATLFMGGLSKQKAGGLLGSLGAGAGGADQGRGMLESLLDADGDGSILDDIAGMFFKR